MNVTRDVIKDLWPAYATKQASASTRVLVEEFLARDPLLARDLGLPIELAPAARARRAHLPAYQWLLLLALVFTGFAFGGIVSDTSWNVPPTGFIVAALVAGGFWVAFLVGLARRRNRPSA